MLPLLAAGCVVEIGSCGSLRLEHQRWVEVTLDTAGLEQFACDTSSGPIELTGGDAGAAKLAVRVDSAVEGDVSVENVARGAELSVDTASGSVSVRSSQPASIRIDSASGPVRFEQSGATALDVGHRLGRPDLQRRPLQACRSRRGLGPDRAARRRRGGRAARRLSGRDDHLGAGAGRRLGGGRLSPPRRSLRPAAARASRTWRGPRRPKPRPAGRSRPGDRRPA